MEQASGQAGDVPPAREKGSPVEWGSPYGGAWGGGAGVSDTPTRRPGGRARGGEAGQVAIRSPRSCYRTV
ncbi:hypothetical protein JCM4814A_78590 [Streptomyces phaeofaciens JCM 4814]